jgi:hypothetical protein
MGGAAKQQMSRQAVDVLSNSEVTKDSRFDT